MLQNNNKLIVLKEHKRKNWKKIYVICEGDEKQTKYIACSICKRVYFCEGGHISRHELSHNQTNENKRKLKNEGNVGNCSSSSKTLDIRSFTNSQQATEKQKKILTNAIVKLCIDGLPFRS